MKNVKKSFLIAVTGCPGAGKSFFSKMLHSMFETGKSRLIDADKLGHAALHIPDVKYFMKTYCAGCIDSFGEIDRKILAKKVFSGNMHYQEFNFFISSYVKKELFNIIESCQEKVLIVDAALIFEWKTENLYDEIVFIDTDKNKREENLRKRGDDPQEYRLREMFLISAEEKRDAGVYVVKNEYNEMSIKKECEKFLSFLEKKHGKFV